MRTPIALVSAVVGFVGSTGALAAVGLALAGCRGGAAPTTADAGVSAAAEAAVAPAESARVPAADAARSSEQPPLPCRAIALEGRVSIEPSGDADGGVKPAELALQGDVPPGWLVLSEGTRLVVKDPRTARETTFHGPARVRACVGGSEEVWVTQGAFESAPGAGEVPGAEEWVVTPQAIVRYAAAKVRVDVRPASTTATMVAGVAFLWPPQRGPMSEGWQRLGSGEARVGPAVGPSGGASAPLQRCVSLARRAQELAAGLLAAVGGAPDAGTVAEQVTTRRLARAACAVAKLRFEDTRGSAGGGSADWAAPLAEAEAAWRTLPIAPVSR